MNPTPEPPRVETRSARPAEADAELLVVPYFEHEPVGQLAELDRATSGELAKAAERRELTGKPYQTFVAGVTDAGWKARRVLVVGAGERAAYGPWRARQVAAVAAAAIRAAKVESVACLCPPVGDLGDTVQATAETLVAGTFDGGTYKAEPDPSALRRIHLLVPEETAPVRARAARGALLGHCTNLAKALVNEPSNVLTPRVFADRAQVLAGEGGIRTEVLDERAIAELKMGLLLGVARGSAEPPRLIVMRYEPDGAPPGPVLGLVGKGITFDTGGISIKPADGMERMKDDMSGGAAVIAAMRAIGMLKPAIRVVGVVPATENMPGGRATKPGDVLTGASGTTVEVINTDAEGRLILGDALWYARQLGATHLVDIATLTGACMVALGKITTGLFGSPPEWVETVRRTADAAGDRSWPLPIFDEYREQIRSDIADVINSGGRPAGAITAAMFLKEFTGGLPWTHMDIAGTAWADENRPYLPKGATGVGVRTLAELPFTSERW